MCVLHRSSIAITPQQGSAAIKQSSLPLALDNRSSFQLVWRSDHYFNLAAWLCAGVGDLHREDADKDMAKTYALLIADTVMVPVEGESLPEKEKDRNLTVSACPKGWTDAAYFFKVSTPPSHSTATECLPPLATLLCHSSSDTIHISSDAPSSKNADVLSLPFAAPTTVRYVQWARVFSSGCRPSQGLDNASSRKEPSSS